VVVRLLSVDPDKVLFKVELMVGWFHLEGFFGGYSVCSQSMIACRSD
jgi:hypothetical protein